MSPTNPELLQEDFDGLKNAFIQVGHFLTAEMLNVAAVHHSAVQLVNLGWIKNATQGRWTHGFAPAGQLAEALS